MYGINGKKSNKKWFQDSYISPPPQKKLTPRYCTKKLEYHNGSDAQLPPLLLVVVFMILFLQWLLSFVSQFS